MKSGRARCHVLGTILLVFSLQVLCEDAPALSAPSPKATPVLLTSYLPAAMQVLAHLSNQMTYPASPSAKPSTLTTARPATTQHTTPKTTTTSTTLSPKATTHKLDLTTKSHGPANYAPFAPPPQRAVVSEPAFHHPIPPLISDTYPHHLLLPEIHEADHIVPVIRSPYPQHSPHYIRDPYPIQETHFPVVLFPSHTYYQPKSPNSEPVFLPGHYDHVYKQDSVFNDWLTKARQGNDETFYIPGENIPNFASIPVENENNFKLNPLELTPDELSDENLQFLSPNVRELVKGINGVDAKAGEGKLNPSANYQSIEELFDNPDERKNVAEWLKVQKALVTQSYIKMILLYDLLSTDAKSQKLNNYNGYTPEILKDLEDASKGSAADQLKTVLDRMIARGDCKYEFANNRAKELAQDLGKPGSTAYMEVQRLEPLKFNV